MQDKPATTGTPIHELLARRWSPRSFDSRRPVAREALHALLEAARWAPSCSAAEPWRFLVWDRDRDAAAWERAAACLDASNREWAERAPLLFAGFAAANFDNGKPNRWSQHDLGAATENLLLQATALGLVAHPMGGFDAAALGAAFAVPEGFAALAMIVVGHPGDAAALSPRNQERERAARRRRPLAERFFEGSWGQGFEP